MMSDQGGGNPAPGWYDDPERPGNRRWWDGTAWTDHSEPIAGPGPAGTSGASGTPSGAPAAGGPPAGAQPPGGQPPGAQPPVARPPGAQPPSATGPAFATAGGPAAGAPNIDTWLWQSIVATVLCCLPLGIPAIVFASQANTEVTNGNYALAQDKAKQAKTFTLIAGGLGLLFYIGWASLFFLPFMFMGF